MERLTEWYDDGEHKGVMVKEERGEQVLKTLFNELDEGYLGMCQLKAYEDTGITPPEVQELKERDTAKVPQKVDEQPYFRKHFDSYACPVCHKKVESSWKLCGHCGQKLKEGNGYERNTIPRKAD